MQQVTTTFQITSGGQVYEVAYVVCEPCLLAEVSVLIASQERERAYGAGKGAFTLSVAPVANPDAAATPANGALHREGPH